jgi:hypothetical protein
MGGMACIWVRKYERKTSLRREGYRWKDNSNIDLKYYVDWIELAHERIQGRPNVSTLNKGPGIF